MPFSETYEPRGYISMDINRMEWIACVACLSGNWSRILLKSKVLWLMIKARPVWRSFVYNVNSRASHLGMSQKRDMDPRSARRFFLARVVSVTYQPWHLYTFHLCGCWNARRLGYRSVRTGKRVFRNCQSSKVREDRPWRIQGLLCAVPRHLLECLERGEELAPCLDSWWNPISNMW